MLNVFISWSGPPSGYVAQALQAWLEDLFPAHLKTFLSSQNLPAGGLWSSTLFANLNQAEFGILCVTRDNMKAPWLQFEAGALAKHVVQAKDRVVPYLLSMQPTDLLHNPLSNLQAVTADREGTLKLAIEVNNSVKDRVYPDDSKLERAFNRLWGDLDKKLRDIESKAPQPELPKIGERELTIEVLAHVKGIAESLGELRGNSTAAHLSEIRRQVRIIMTNAITNQAFTQEAITALGRLVSLTGGAFDGTVTGATGAAGATGVTGVTGVTGAPGGMPRPPGMT